MTFDRDVMSCENFQSVVTVDGSQSVIGSWSFTSTGLSKVQDVDLGEILVSEQLNQTKSDIDDRICGIFQFVLIKTEARLDRLQAN